MPEASHGVVAAPGLASNTVGLGFDGTTPSVQPFAGWARLLVVLAWVALLASILFMFTFPDWSDAQVRASDGMVLRDAQWSLDTENASEQWVTLPHRTPPFDTPTTSRYRLAFDLDQPLPSEQRLGLCVARWALSADVWLDGQRLATALQGFNALLEWNRPHYLALPPAGKGPGIVLFQEIFGVNRHIRAVAEQYAMDGFVVLTPDVFWRQAPIRATGMMAASEVACASSWWNEKMSTSVGTKMMPPPTPKRPASTPAATPQAIASESVVASRGIRARTPI